MGSSNIGHPINIVTRKANGAGFTVARLFGKLQSGFDVAPCGAGEQAHCVVPDIVADNKPATCEMFDGTDLLIVTAGGSVTAGDEIASDAAGKAVTAAGSAKVLGVAEDTVTTGQPLSFRPLVTGKSKEAVEMRKDSITITGAAGSAGVFASWANDSGVDVYATGILNPSVVSTGAATIDIGATTVSATTVSDTGIDGYDATASIAVDTAFGTGTNGKLWNLVPAGKWITVAEASGDVNGFVGVLTIIYFPA